MKLLINLLLLTLIVTSTNCTVLKKRYSKGYTIEWHKNYKNSNGLVEEIQPTKVELIDSTLESTENNSQNNTAVIPPSTAELEHDKNSVKRKIDFPKIKSLKELKNNTLNKLIQKDSKEEQPSEKPINIYSTISLALTIALVLIGVIIYLASLTNPFLLLICIFILLGSFIFALVANSQLTKQPETYSHLSKLFTLPSIIIYLLICLALLIFGIVLISLVLASTNLLFLLAGLIAVIIFFALLSLVLTLSILWLRKSYHPLEVKDKNTKPRGRPHNNPYKK